MKVRWQDEAGTWHASNRCPSFLLHLGRQCNTKSSSFAPFPYYCAKHNLPVESIALGRGRRVKPCRQCMAERRAKVDEWKVEDETFVDLLFSRAMTRRAAIYKLLEDNPEELRACIEDVCEGLREIESGFKWTGEERIVQAVGDLGLAIAEAFFLEWGEAKLVPEDWGPCPGHRRGL